MLPNFFPKVKSWYESNKSDLYTALIIFLVGMAGFGLGRLSVLWPQKEPLTITQTEESTNAPINLKKGGGGENPLPASIIKSAQGRYVASKSGSYYHYPWCAGALRIKEANKIWFQTKEEAEGGGYKPAGNCPGL